MNTVSRFFVLSLLALVIIPAAAPAADNDQTTTAVRAVLDTLAKAMETRDMDLLLSCFSTDPNVVLYGTGADEKRIGIDGIRTQVERDWSQSEAMSVSYEWVSVASEGKAAWAAIDGTVHFRTADGDGTMPVRLTFVLVKKGDSWKIVQGHFSTPMMAQSEGESFPDK